MRLDLHALALVKIAHSPNQAMPGEVRFGQDNYLAIYPFTVLKVSSLKNKTLRIFQGCLTVQLSKCCVVVSLLFTGATLIYYHGFLCLSTTFLIFLFLFAGAQRIFQMSESKTEKEGFEPSRRFNTTYTLSRGASSAS